MVRYSVPLIATPTPLPNAVGEWVRWEDHEREAAALRARVAELTAERDEAQANYAFMVERAANEKLDGYRELGARAAAA